MLDLAQRLELVVAQDGLVHRDLPRVVGRLVEEVALRADARGQRHDDGLADRVDRRVRHLREELLEVGEQRGALVGEHGERGVVAHGADGLLALAGHGREQDAQVLLAPAERLLLDVQRVAAHGGRLALGQVVEVDDVVGVPAPVGLAGGHLLLDLLVLDDPPLPRSTRKSLPGARRPRRLTLSGARRASRSPSRG
jgi:hypothetical protein